jgi:hypothetical protein
MPSTMAVAVEKELADVTSKDIDSLCMIMRDLGGRGSFHLIYSSLS